MGRCRMGVVGDGDRERVFWVEDFMFKASGIPETIFMRDGWMESCNKQTLTRTKQSNYRFGLKQSCHWKSMVTCGSLTDYRCICLLKDVCIID